MAVSVSTFANRLETRMEASGTGSFFADLVAFLKDLIPLITSLGCFAAAKNKADVAKNIDEEFRATIKKRKGRTNRKVRRLMAKYGCDDSDDQDSVWVDLTAESFADAQNVAATLLAAA